MKDEGRAKRDQAKASGLRPAQRFVEIHCRDDGKSKEWNELVARAIERREVPTKNYLLDRPLLAEHRLDGLERRGLGGLVADAD